MGARRSDHTPITRILVNPNCPAVGSRARRSYELNKGLFGAFEPNTLTRAKVLYLSRARERDWKRTSHLLLMASARMIGREGPSWFTSWISGFQKRAFTLWYSKCVGPVRCRRVDHEMHVLIPNCGLFVFMCASRQTVPNHVFCRGLTSILVPNHVHVSSRADIALVSTWISELQFCNPKNLKRTGSRIVIY